MVSEKRKIKISLTINIIIVLFTILASIIMFTGFKFMEGDLVLESTKIGMFRFFTVDSNIFMGIVAIIFSIKEIELIKDKITSIPSKIYILKLIATVGVALTFAIVFGYLGPIAKGGIPSMIKNSNLFFHLLIPLLSILNFIIFERTDKIRFKSTFIGTITAVIYGIYYLINVLIHMEDGRVSTIYDWYWFVQGGVWQAIIVIPLVLGITYAISVLLWRFNRVKNKTI